MNYFITQYALTRGIFEIEGEVNEEHKNLLMAHDPYRTGFFRPHWHIIRAEAVKRAELMRVKAIQSMRARIQKLETMKFE